MLEEGSQQQQQQQQPQQHKSTSNASGGDRGNTQRALETGSRQQLEATPSQ